MRERTSRDLDIYLSPLDRPLSYDHEFDDMQTSLPSKLPPTVDIFDGQIIPIGHLKLTVVHTPGHTPGHVSLHCEEHGFLYAESLLILLIMTFEQPRLGA